MPDKMKCRKCRARFGPEPPHTELKPSLSEVQREIKNETLYSMASLYFDPKYSDWTIICGNESFPVHRCVLSPRSEVFAKEFEWKAGKDDRETLLPDDDPIVIEKMIQYLYTLDYSAPVEADIMAKIASAYHHDVSTSLPPEEMAQPTASPPDPSSPKEETEITQEVKEFQTLDPSVGQLATKRTEEPKYYFDPTFFHIQIYALAERFQIHGLKSLARRYFHDTLESRLNSVSFSEVVEEVYSATPDHDRGLREAVVNVALNHLLELRRSNALPDDFLNGNGKNRDFGRDLCVAMIHREEREFNSVLY